MKLFLEQMKQNNVPAKKTQRAYIWVLTNALIQGIDLIKGFFLIRKTYFMSLFTDI